MSFRRPWIAGIASRVERFRKGASRRRRRVEIKPRRLAFDPLEQRVLLSLTALNTTDLLASQPIPASQLAAINSNSTTNAAHSIATDNKGDYAVVWSADNYSNVNGNFLGQDIFAQYYTNDVQQITLPAISTLPLQAGGSGLHTISLVYGGDANGHVVQKLSITATTQPFTLFQSDIAGHFTLSLKVGSTTYVSHSIAYTEDNLSLSNEQNMVANALAIQNGLQNAGGPFAGVTVAAVDARDFNITFGAAYNTAFLSGYLTGASVLPVLNQSSATWTSGFLPAVEATMVTQPNIMPDIPVSAANPYDTAAAIQNWFNFYGTTAVATAPTMIENPAGGGVGLVTVSSAVNGFPGPEPYSAPVILPVGSVLAGQITLSDGTVEQLVELPSGAVVPLVSPGNITGTTLSVVPDFDPNPSDTAAAQLQYSLTHFNIEFTGDNGTQIQAPLQLTSDTGAPVLLSSVPDVATILKQSSGQFMVNQPQTSPFAPPGSVTEDNENPAVAMDPNGNFIIAWQSMVPTSVTPGSGFDIFARRFSPTTYAASHAAPIWNASGVMVPCVLPVLAPTDPNLYVPYPANDPYTFRVNNFTTNNQTHPDVAVDPNGDFTFVWQGEGQEISYFNGIGARQFYRTGHPVGGDVAVNAELTNYDFQPYVAMDNRGDFGVSWTDTWDPNYLPPLPLPGGTFTATLKAAIYDANGNILASQTQIVVPQGAAGGDSTIAFDANNEFTITWDELSDRDNIGGTSEGVYGAEWQLTPATQTFLYDNTDPGETENTTVTFAVGTLHVTINTSANATTATPITTTAAAALITSALTQLGHPGATVVVTYDGAGGGDVTVTFASTDHNTTPFTVSDDATFTNGGPPVHLIDPVTITPSSVQIIRDKFRVNSGDLVNWQSPTQWPGDQLLAQVAVDADGDMTVAYEGYGPAVVENTQIAVQYYTAAIEDPANADIAAYLDDYLPSAIIGHPIPELGYEGLTGSVGSDGSVLGALDAVLIGAADALAPTTALTAATPVLNKTDATDIIYVSSSAGFPVTAPFAPFTITVGTEQMTVTQVSGTAWTVTRAVNGSTEAVHHLGDTVTGPLGQTTTLLLPVGATTIDVASNAGFPAANFPVLIDGETLTVSSTAGNVWTLSIPTTLTHALNASVTDRQLNAAGQDKLGRIQAILDNVAGLLNGSADGILFSQFDTNPTVGVLGPSQVLLSDSVANNTRSGNNEQDILILDRGPNWQGNITVAGTQLHDEDIVNGSFQLLITNPLNGLQTTVTIPIVRIGNLLTGTLDTALTEFNIDNILGTAPVLGGATSNWVPTVNDTQAEGSVDVRWVQDPEISARAGTAWDLAALAGSSIDATPDRYYVFEVTFQGEAHDLPLEVSYVPNSNTLALSDVDEELELAFAPSAAVDELSTVPAGDAATPPAQPRKFALTIDGKNTTADMSIDLDPTQTLAAFEAGIAATGNSIQTAITNLATQNPTLAGALGGVTVQWLWTAGNPTIDPVTGEAPAGDQFITQGFFDIVFDGPYAGLKHTVGQGTPVTPAPVPVGGTPPPPQPFDQRYAGGISSMEITQGMVPTVLNSGYPLSEYFGYTSLAPEAAGQLGTAQIEPSVAETSSGNLVFAWTQQDMYTDSTVVPPGIPTDPSGSTIYTRQFKETTDTAGPRVAGLFAPNGTRIDGVTNSQAPTGPVTHLVISFDEPMLNYPPVAVQLAEQGYTPANAPAAILQHAQSNWANSVINPANYQLLLGSTLAPQAATIQYGLNEASVLAAGDPAHYADLTGTPANRLEVVLTFAQPLAIGTYTLTLLHPVASGSSGLENADGNPLNKTGFVPGGADTVLTFTLTSMSGGTAPGSPPAGSTDAPISPIQAGNQIDPAVAEAANGNYVIVWTSNVGGQYEVVGQMFNSVKTPIGTEFIVSASANAQSRPSIAMDAAGDFVVVWSGAGPDTNTTTNTSDIFAREYDSNGIGHQQFQVNVYENSVQDEARVAMDPGDGSFVVTWTSYGQPAAVNGATQSNNNIFYREFALNGSALGATAAGEQQVNAVSIYSRGESDAAMDANGDFVIVWNSFGASTNTVNIVGNYYSPLGAKSSGEFTLNTRVVQQSFTDQNSGFGTGAPIDLWSTGPRVSMAANTGSFVAVWANYQSTTSNGYNIYERRFAAPAAAGGGAPLARDAVELQVNNTAPVTPTNQVGWQLMPDVSADANGNFTVVWTSFGQDNAENNNPNLHDYGVYAKMYLDNGSVDPATTGQFRVNMTTAGNQVAPAVDRKASNSFAAVAWVGPTTAAAIPTGIFAQVYDPPSTPGAGLTSTTATLVASANPAVAGQKVTFTATVKTATAGTVTFKDGAAVLGTAALNASGQATYTTSALALGSHAITASYPGALGFGASTSNSVTEQVNQAATTNVLIATIASQTFGQWVGFLAAVRIVAPGAAFPTGTVTFKDGPATLGTAALDASGNATLYTQSLAVGPHTITATYAGTANFAASTSGNLSETITPALTATTTSLGASASSAAAGQSLTFTATVTSAGAPVTTGTVTFKDGATILTSTAPLNASGKATFATSALAAGSHVITASYSGTSSLAASTSSGLTEQVNQAATTTLVIATVNPATAGQAVGFLAAVRIVSPGAGIATGAVTFKDGATVLGTATLDVNGNAILFTSSLAAGPHTITAAYAGTANLITSTSGNLTETVNSAAAANPAATKTTTSVTASVNPAAAGQAVAFTAIVATAGAGVPTGTVTFKDGAAILTSTAAINASGQATFTTSALAAGSHAITASYAGTASFAASTSSSLAEQVNQAATTTLVIATVNPSTAGQWVGFLAAVRIVSPGAGIANGTVTFKDGANVLGTAPLDVNGNAILFTQSLTVGPHTITATYAGTANLITSTSGNFIETVGTKVATSVTRAPLAPAAVDQVMSGGH